MAIVASGFAPAQGGQGTAAAPLSRGKIAPVTAEVLDATLAPSATRLSAADREDDWAALAAGPEGRLAVSWIAFDGQTDHLLLRETRRTGPQPSWTETEELAGAGDFFCPAVAYDGSGTLWVVWSANVRENFELFARRRTAAGWQSPLRLTNAAGSDIVPRLATDPQGRVWMAWQGFRNGSFDILLARLTESGLADERAVTADKANDWAPALAVGPSGAIYVTWDSYRNGSYNVYLRRFSSSGEASAEIPLAVTAAREANASIAVDASDRAWVAYDIGEANWGRHVRLHGQRTIGLCCWDGNTLGALPVDFMPSLPHNLQARSECPQIAFDGKGCLHVAFQHFVPQKDAGKGKRAEEGGGVKGIFYWYATATDGKQWTKPVAFAESAGRGDNRLRLAQAEDGQVFAAWAADGRSFPYYEVPMEGDIFAGRLEGSVAAAGKLPTVALAKSTAEVPPPDPNSQRPRLEPKHLGGETYLLAYGDTHRHTDISRCGLGADGTLIDTYRYGIDVAGLDFLAISDHDQDLGGWRFQEPAPKNQQYPWWRSQKLADVYTLPGHFLALYGYERGRTYKEGGGHKNVLYARRGYPISFETEPSALFRELAGRGAIVIPHQLADAGEGTDWNKWAEPFERVAEIFQARGSYECADGPQAAQVFREGNSLQDAFRKGVHIGIVASSDHGSTHHAYAGTLIKQFTREGILEAMQQRRTFGATEVIEVTATLAGRPMGQEVTVDAPPSIEIAACCAEPLSRVEVVKDNRLVYSRDLSDKEARLTFQDHDSKPASAAYYYVRVTTVGGALAWTSPFWVTRK
jgi:hypothetical protein